MQSELRIFRNNEKGGDILKKYIIVLTLIFGILWADKLFASSCHSGHKHKEYKEKVTTEKEDVKEKVVYTCPMNCIPDYTSDNPGRCPKCGMNLEAKKQETKKQFFEETRYVCSCTGTCCKDVKSDKPGKCPKCGKSLKEDKKLLFSYVCPTKKCDYKSSEPGKCPHHKKELKKVEVKLYCPHDGAELQTKEGKLYCPKCEHEVSEKDAKIKEVKKKK